MKKIELLCPDGNKKILENVIQNGADTVYLSEVKFEPHKFANNFTNEEIAKVINYAHLYGIKVYITINTHIKDNEVREFLKYAEFIHKANVDALLTQDIGKIYIARNIFLNLEIYTSTQFHNCNIRNSIFLKEIDVKSAILARKLRVEPTELCTNYQQLFGKIPKIETFIFRKIKQMILKHCAINEKLNSSNSCNICESNKKYCLKDRNKEKNIIKNFIKEW